MIELMITVTILAILALLGLPSFRAWIRDAHIRNAAESIQNGLRLARNEAVQRDTSVRFQLISATSADWTVCVLTVPTATTCPAPAANNPNTIQSFAGAGGAVGVLLGATTDVTYATGNYSTEVSGGLPAGATFNALGRSPSYGLNDVVRIDATASETGSRRLVTTISPGGQTRMCDPQLSLSVSPQGCN